LTRTSAGPPGRPPCPACGGDSRAIETRRAAGGGTVRRRRCVRCAAVFRTLERVAGEDVEPERNPRSRSIKQRGST
jgi:transcriptional regulator NrdR family protein